MLLENENVSTEQVETTSTGVAETQTQENSASTVEATGGKEMPNPNPTETKTFTQEMVDEIVRNRLERDRNATFRRYGVENRDGLDNLIGKAQAYDVMKERYGKIKEENGQIREKMAFMSNNINPSKEEDVRAYFKGKGIEFNETNLINELVTHPEWLNVKQVNESPQTTIKSLGVEHAPLIKHETAEEKEKRIFGV